MPGLNTVILVVSMGTVNNSDCLVYNMICMSIVNDNNNAWHILLWNVVKSLVYILLWKVKPLGYIYI